jgi:hypothetical protein
MFLKKLTAATDNSGYLIIPVRYQPAGNKIEWNQRGDRGRIQLLNFSRE